MTHDDPRDRDARLLSLAGALSFLGGLGCRHATVTPAAAVRARPTCWSAASKSSTPRSTRWSSPTPAPRCWRRATSGPRAGLDGRRAAVLRRPQQRRSGAGRDRAACASSCARAATPARPARRRAGLERPDARRVGPARPVPARRPAHRAPDPPTARLQDRRRPLRRQALQQPQRSGRRANGNLYFTDPIYGLVGHVKDPARGDPLQRRLPRASRPRARRCSTRS